MDTFQPDNSGFVSLGLHGKVPADWMDATAWVFSDLDPFTQGSIEAALSDFFEPSLPNISSVAFSDLAPETLARIIEDCAAAQNEGWKRGRANPASLGRTFWTARQSGGVRAFPPLTVTLGDDGKVYLTERGAA